MITIATHNFEKIYFKETPLALSKVNLIVRNGTLGNCKQIMKFQRSSSNNSLMLC